MQGASGSPLAARSYRLDDPARLQALAGYRDPDPERLHQLREVAALAARLLRVQVSMLGLVDRDRVVVHALQGMRPQATLEVTPVWEAILGSVPLFVWQADPLEDAGGIPLLSPGAATPGLFVAAPLVSPENAVIGALCVSDPVPRRLSADDRATLAVLADQAMSLMELHRVIRREADARFAAATMAGRTRIAFSLAGLGDWRWAPATDLTVLSPRAAQIYGLPADQPIRRETLLDIIAPAHREHVRRQFESAIRERRGFHLEFGLRHRDGREVWVQTHGAGVHDAAGRILEVVGVIHDISARRLAEVQLRTREDRAWMKAELVNRVQDLDNPADVAIHAVRVVVERLGIRCGGFCRILDNGCLLPSRDRTIGDAADIENGIGLARLDPGLMRRLASAVPVEIDTASGCPVDGLSIVVPACTAQLCALVRHGKPVALFWFAADRERGWRDGEAQALQAIVELAYAHYARAQARRAAKAGERRLLLVADWMPQLAWLARADGQTIWFNQRWLEYSGFALDQLVNGGWLALCHPDDRGAVEAGFQRGVLTTNRGWEATFRLRRADGRYRWQLSRAISFATGNDEEPLLWFGTLTDVSEQRLLAEKREVLLESERLARLEAEGASRLKDEFLATLSHELRTPLTAMLGWSQVLRRTGHDPALVRQGVEIIERNAQIQSQIVEDLLDMSAIASGKLRLDCTTLALAPLVESAIRAVTPAADARRIRIVFDDLGEGLRVLVDEARLAQVMNNLLTNAIKFSPPRSAVDVALTAEAGQGVIAIRDQGIGMTAEFLPHVFERFRQADGSNTRLHGGLGLGLAIVRQLLELHGGAIDAVSPGLGKGSTFTVRLPRVTEAAVPVDRSV